MNWQASGAIGEILGAVLVGATLIYLALQLRQNTKALSSLTTGGSGQWWETSKMAFSDEFVRWMDSQQRPTWESPLCR